MACLLVQECEASAPHAPGVRRGGMPLVFVVLCGRAVRKNECWDQSPNVGLGLGGVLGGWGGS